MTRKRREGFIVSGLYSILAVPYSLPSDEGNVKQKCLMLDLVGFNFFFYPI